MDTRVEQLRSRDFISIFLVSCTVMLYQITLTRVLSVVVWYHFAFLSISMVMLGLGVPGVWFALARRPMRFLPGFLLASGIAVPVSVALIVKFGTVMLASHVAWIVLCILPATLSLGGVVCLLLIKASGRSVTRMYGVDLLGAALGALLVIPLMILIPTPLLAAGSGFLPLISLALYPGALRPWSLGLMVVLAGVLIHGEAYHITRSKQIDETMAASTPIFETWSPTARITIFDENFFILGMAKSGFVWGKGAHYPKGRNVPQMWLHQDGGAGTPITKFDGDLQAVQHLLYDVTTLGYQLRPPDSVAVIGGGGGRDILSALLSGARDIDVVELNGATIEAVSERFGEFSGDIYHAEGVNAIENEGRSHLTHTDKIFDLIQISLIDSFAASAAGAFALAENNLYTMEAFQLYNDRLTERGLISTSRWMSELPRLIVLTHSALEAMGGVDPKQHIIIASAEKVATLLTSRTAFGAADLERLDEICRERGFERLYPVPAGQPPANAFIASLVDDRLTPMEKLGLNTSPPTDDSPYFFQLLSPFERMPDDEAAALQHTGLDMNTQSTRVLQQAIYGVVVLSLLLFLLPFVARVREEERVEPLSHLVRGSIYFAAIGCAFMLVENVLVQHFVLYLGHPSYATTVIIASLLLGMGIGSMGSERVGLWRLQKFGLVVPLVTALGVVALPHFFSASLGLPLLLRMASSFMILFPLGAMLGVFFPLGMLRFGDRAKPWYWAINGVAGVVASVMSLALSMDFGFTTVGLLSAAVYVVAWICLGGEAAIEIEAGEAAIEE